MLLIYLPYLACERRADVEVRGQLAAGSSFLPQSETWGSNSGHPAWQQGLYQGLVPLAPSVAFCI